MPEPSDTTLRRVFAIFEGGGARGITHVGALKAMESLKFGLVGVAGASAGAIVAALTAAGYTADQLFREDVGDALTSRGKTPIDLLGRDDWNEFCRLRALRPPRLWQLLLVLVLLIPTLIALALLYAAHRMRWPHLHRSANRILAHLGLFSTEGARDLLNDMIREQVRDRMTRHDRDVPDLICFRDIDPSHLPGFIRLKIVATDLATGRLKLFDQTTPDVVVADAVAASIAIPFFFRPARVRRVADAGGGVRAVTTEDAIFCDGGLVSNLPAWVFSEEKRALERDRPTEPPIPIVALALAATAADASAATTPSFARFYAYLKTVLATGIFSSQTVVQRFVPDLTVVSLPSPLKTLSFDCTRPEARQAFVEGRIEAARALQRMLVNRPRAVQDELDKVLALARSRSAELRGTTELPRMRAYLVAPFGSDSFRIVGAAGFALDHADDRLLLDRGHPGGPAAIIQRGPILARWPTRPDDLQKLRMTKYERALVHRGLASIVAIPIFGDVGAWNLKTASERPEPAGAICVDSEIILDQEFADGEFLGRLVKASHAMVSLLAWYEE